MRKYFVLFLFAVFLLAIATPSHAFTLYWKDGHTQELKTIIVKGDKAECQVPKMGLWFDVPLTKIDIGKTLESKKKEEDELKVRLEAEEARIAAEEKKKLEEEKAKEQKEAEEARLAEQKLQEEEKIKQEEEQKEVEAEKILYRKKIGEKIWKANNGDLDLIKLWCDDKDFMRLTSDDIYLKKGDRVKVINDYSPNDQNQYEVIYLNPENKIIRKMIDGYLLESEESYQERIREQKEEAKKEAERRKAEEKILSTFPVKFRNRIRKHEIWLGMTEEMALASRGAPDSINRDVGSWGVHEQWVYGDSTYLYFENGILTSWQD